MNGKNVMLFFSAALPWVTLGLLIAIFCARSARRKKDEDPEPDYGTEGMCLGLCLGTAMGTAAGQPGVSMLLGMLLGLIVGSSVKKEEKDNETEEKEGKK